MERLGFAPLSQVLPFWPSDILGQPEFLDEIGVRDFDVQEGDNLLIASGHLLWFREIAFDLPLLSGFSLALLNESGFTVVPFQIDVLPQVRLRIPEITITLRVETDLLRRVERVEEKWKPLLD